MPSELTQRQRAILRFIVECIRENRCPPTMMEIGKRFGIASMNGVNDHLVALERKGYIARSSKKRSIRLTEKAAFDLARPDAATLPLVGRIAAGQPLLAEENVESHVVVSNSLAARGAFCLRVQGESMIEDGILEGDIIIVDPSREPVAGDVVVALVNDEATVKRFYPHGAKVELRPANAAMHSIFVSAKALRIQGVVTALQRAIR